MSEITEIQFVDTWYHLNLGSKYVYDSDKILKRLCDLFAFNGLKIKQNQFGSSNFDKIRLRYTHITEKITKNKKTPSRDKHFGFKSEKLFFSAKDMPNLCEKEVSKR